MLVKFGINLLKTYYIRKKGLCSSFALFVNCIGGVQETIIGLLFKFLCSVRQFFEILKVKKSKLEDTSQLHAIDCFNWYHMEIVWISRTNDFQLRANFYINFNTDRTKQSILSEPLKAYQLCRNHFSMYFKNSTISDPSNLMSFNSR